MTMSKGRKNLSIAVLFLASIIAMADFFIVPFMSNFYTDFAGHENLVNFIVSGPTLIGFFTSLLSAPLVKKFNAKFVIIVSLVLGAIGGIFCVADYSAWYVAAMRMLIGAGMGFNSVGCIMQINDMFTDEAERSRVLGWFYSFESLIGVVISLVVGRIPPENWKFTFNLYWVLVPVLLLVILFLPAVKTRNDAADETKQGDGSAAPQSKFSMSEFVILCLATVLVQIFFNSFFFLSSLYVDAKGIGGAAASSIISSLVTAGTFVIGFAFAKMYEKMKRGIVVLIFGLMALGYLILTIFSSLPLTYLASLLIGVSNGLALAYFPMHISVISPANKVEKYQSTNQAVYMVAIFTSTYAVSFVSSIMHTDNMLGVMPVYTIVAAVCTVLAVVLAASKKREA